MKITKAIKKRMLDIFGIPDSEIQELREEIKYMKSRIANVEMHIAPLSAVQMSNIDRAAEVLMPIGCTLPLERIGGPHDGGYLLIDKANMKSILSLGVGNEVSADIDLIKSNDAQIYAFDPYVERPEITSTISNYLFRKLGVAKSHVIDENGREFVDFKTIKAYCPDGLDLVLIDIEGSEWDSFKDSSDFANVKQIVIELHDLHRAIDASFSEGIVQLVKNVFQDFRVVHVHGNNAGQITHTPKYRWPSILEVTLVNTKFYGELLDYEKSGYDLIHKLDFPNTPDRPDIDLRPIWANK